MEPFGTIFAKWSKKYQKALGFPLKVDAVLRLCKTLQGRQIRPHRTGHSIRMWRGRDTNDFVLLDLQEVRTTKHYENAMKSVLHLTILRLEML